MPNAARRVNAGGCAGRRGWRIGPESCSGDPVSRFALVFAALTVLAGAGPGQSAPTPTARIIDEEMNHSQVITAAEHLADVIGPRITTSPAMRQTEEGAAGKFRGWGLANVHKEAFTFGRGWWIERASVRMATPRPLQLTAIPIAWTSPTDGVLSAGVVVAPMKTVRDFARSRGKIGLVSEPGTGGEPAKPAFQRLSDEELGKLGEYQPDAFDPAQLDRDLKRADFTRELETFLQAEGARACATKAYRDGKLVSGEDYRYAADDHAPLPAVQIAAEDYRRLVRLAIEGQAPTLEIDSAVHFDTRVHHSSIDAFDHLKADDMRQGATIFAAFLLTAIARDPLPRPPLPTRPTESDPYQPKAED